MTPSAETAPPTKEPDLRFAKVVSVHEESGETIIVFRDWEGAQHRVIFPFSENRWLLESFLRLYGEGR